MQFMCCLTTKAEAGASAFVRLGVLGVEHARLSGVIYVTNGACMPQGCFDDGARIQAGERSLVGRDGVRGGERDRGK